MRNKLFLTLAIIGISFGSFAQLPYTLTVYSQAYVPLDSATVLDPGQVWNTNYNFAAPVGFNFYMDTIDCPNFYSIGGNFAVTDTANVTSSGFIITDASLDDRGYLGDTVSRSPLRYKLTGTPGNLIFKAEFFNAGFDQQLQDSLPMTDSVNFQVWYYEDSGTVELRYGPSLITGTDYFNFGNGPLVGYACDNDTNGNGNIYLLNGDPLHPTIQTVVQINGNLLSTPLSLNSYPVNGTVYRFSRLHPINLVSVPEVFTSENVSVFPTRCSNEIKVKYSGPETPAYEIFSVTGIKMGLSGQVQKGLNHIDLSNFPPGMYLLHLQGAGDSKVYKFVKI